MEPQPQNVHKKWSVVLAFALPLLLIIGVLLSSGASLFQPTTTYDFIYATCEDNRDYYSYSYRECEAYLHDYVMIDEEGRFIPGTINADRDTDRDGVLDKDEGIKVRFFYYNAANDESYEIIEREVESYTFSPLLTSPDGVTVEYEYRNSPDVLFVDVGVSGYEYRLVKGNRSKPINLVDGVNHRYGSGNFEFVGWVLAK